MENLHTALFLSLTAKRNLSIHTDNYEECVEVIKRIVQPAVTEEDVLEIDLALNPTYNQLASSMVKCVEGSMPSLHRVVLWRNLEALEENLQTKANLLRVFNDLERYNTLASKSVSPDTPVKFGEYMVVIPDLFIIIAVIVAGEDPPKVIQKVKEQFWFCQSYFTGNTPEITGPHLSAHKLAEAREKLELVHVDPEVQQYVGSLMVFTRSHRLCSLAPLTTRPTLRGMGDIVLLAKALVVRDRPRGSLFVTPEYVKVAFRKVGYWLVDWETNRVFYEDNSALDSRRRSEIAMLTGDWYGSEWPCVERYLDDYVAVVDKASTTGYTNQIVDEVLESVRPPL